MGRLKRETTVKVSALVPLSLYAEFQLLHPELQDHRGHTKYGTVSAFVIQSIREAVEKRKTELVGGGISPPDEGEATGDRPLVEGGGVPDAVSPRG